MPEDERLNQDMKKIRETVTGRKDEDSYYDGSEEVELDESEGHEESESQNEEEGYYEDEEEIRPESEQRVSGRQQKEEASQRDVEETSRDYDTETSQDYERENSREKVREEKSPDHEKEVEYETTGSDDSLMSDIPEPPKTKKIEIPDIETGPLFIRVEKFKKAKKMVKEMHEMDEDLKTRVAGLKSTLEEDKNISKNVYDTLRELQDSMNSIKKIVSPDTK